MVLDGSALPHKKVSNRSAQRDMNIALFPVTRDFLNFDIFTSFVSVTYGTKLRKFWRELKCDCKEKEKLSLLPFQKRHRKFPLLVKFG